jgi:hypothetical protein
MELSWNICCMSAKICPKFALHSPSTRPFWSTVPSLLTHFYSAWMNTWGRSTSFPSERQQSWQPFQAIYENTDTLFAGSGLTWPLNLRWHGTHSYYHHVIITSPCIPLWVSWTHPPIFSILRSELSCWFFSGMLWIAFLRCYGLQINLPFSKVNLDSRLDEALLRQ